MTVRIQYAYLKQQTWLSFRNEGKGPVTGLLLVVGVDVSPAELRRVKVNEVCHDYCSEAQRTSQTARLCPSGPMIWPRSRL